MTNNLSFLARISAPIAKIGQFWNDPANGTILRWNLIMILIQFGFAWYRYNDLPPEIPLFYSRPWGAEQLANSSQIFLLPVSSFIVLMLNIFFSVFLLRTNSLLSKLLIITSLVFSAFALIAIVRSVSLVV